jgi:acyl-CoA synthetase (NDP forming)
MTILEEYKPMFYPATIAVIGASKNQRKLGYHCLTSLVKSGFKGKIYPVNPNLSEVYGFKVYPSVRDIPDKVDLAVIVVPRHIVPSLIKECAEKSVKGIILITAGFKEAEDDVGAKLQKEIAALASKFKIKVIGPNTFGIVNLHMDLDASFTPEFSLMEKGNISLISQSGGFCHLIASLSLKEGGGFSKIIGLGNRCNVDFADMLEYLGEDPETKVIAMFIEGVDDARRLFEVTSYVARKKPIVAYKAGRFKTSDEASRSHTGSLAGRYDLYVAAFKQSCVITVNSSEEMLDVAKAFSMCPLPEGKRVAVLSAQAGLGMTTCDFCEENGLEIAVFTEKTIQRIKELLPPLSMRTNPVDMGPAWYNWETSRKVIETVSIDKNVDALLLLAAYASANEPLVREVAEPLKALARQKPVVTCFPAPRGIWLKEKKELESAGVPVYPTPERASKALAKLVEYAESLKAKQKFVVD